MPENEWMKIIREGLTEEEHDRYDMVWQGAISHSDFPPSIFKKNETCRSQLIKGWNSFWSISFCRMQLLERNFDSLSEDGKISGNSGRKSMDSEIPYGGMTEWKLQKGFGMKKK